MITAIKTALGWLAGSILGLVILIALIVFPVFVVLWIGVAMGVPAAIAVQVQLVIWLSAVATALDGLLPAWGWFAILAMLWLAFLDVHVRWLVRDEFSKQKAQNERSPQ